jgi:hypothetical protein
VEGGDAECAEGEVEAEVPEVEDAAGCAEEEPCLFLGVEEEGCWGAVVGGVLEGEEGLESCLVEGDYAGQIGYEDEDELVVCRVNFQTIERSVAIP